MSIDIKTRKFLTSDSSDTSIVTTNFVVEEDHAYAEFVVREDSESFSVYIGFHDKADTNKALKKLRDLANEIHNFVDLVEDNKQQALKAVV